ncbi:conserved hypothetical protein [Ricinus communis]|uniref:Uncharacterized protein n=1 Tax=Ricinus communis TaxID=3988 RepID=B9T082_RICCO|nr:conserved hypothetical protein [Ricinus communis]
MWSRTCDWPATLQLASTSFIGRVCPPRVGCVEWPAPRGYSASVQTLLPHLPYSQRVLRLADVSAITATA